MLALVLPVTLGLACGLKRDWSVCAPDEKQKCLPGYVCTPDLSCVLPDGGSDALAAVDARSLADVAGGSADGPVPVGTDGPGSAGPDTAGPPVSPSPDGAVSTPGLDGSEPDRAPVSVSPDAAVAAVPDAPAAGGTPDAPPTASPPDAPAAGGSPDAPPTASPPDAPPPDSSPIGPTVDAAGSCSTDKDCSPQSPLCLNHRCAKCVGDSDCTGRSGTQACAASGLCVACTANTYCRGVAATCDTSTNQCVGCVTRSDCAGACQTCNAGVCTAVKNQDDPACPGTCDATGACKSKQGQACQQTGASGCLAGTICAPDGICCDKTCDSPCMACDILGFLGICKAVASGPPHGNRASCGTDTTCGGACAGKADGTCSYPTTNCGSGPSCSGTDKVVAQSTCASGACQPPVATVCQNAFACTGGACKTSCLTSADCQTGYYCSNQKCIAGTPHKFVGGPCIVTPLMADAATEVYGRGDDGHIYRDLYTPTSQPLWSVVSGIDAGAVADSSDLDCSVVGTTAEIQMVALGSMPLGSVLRATGTGNTFTAFSAYNTPGVPILTLSPSVETAFDGFSLAATVSRTGATSLTFYRYAADSTLTTSTSPTLTKTITSGPDVDYDIAGYDVHTFVAFMDDGTMGLLSWSGYMGSGWSTPQYFGPPSGTTFQYSPSICQVHSMIDASPVHLVAAAGDRLWHSYFTAAGYTAWEKISDIAVASAPDCAVSSHGDLLGVVALGKTGTILHVHGSSGAFTTVDLGVFQ